MKPIFSCLSLVVFALSLHTRGEAAPPVAIVRAAMDDQAPGWRGRGPDDFAPVNSASDTWTWQDGVLLCTGQPVSVLRSAKEYKNFKGSFALRAKVLPSASASCASVSCPELAAGDWLSVCTWHRGVNALCSVPHTHPSP